MKIPLSTQIIFLLIALILLLHESRPRRKWPVCEIINNPVLCLQKTEDRLDWISAGIRIYFRKHKAWPSPRGDLRRNLEFGGVVYGTDPNACPPPWDAWNTNFAYGIHAETATLMSAGADLQFGTADDLSRTITITNGTNTVWGSREETLWKQMVNARK